MIGEDEEEKTETVLIFCPFCFFSKSSSSSCCFSADFDVHRRMLFCEMMSTTLWYVSRDCYSARAHDPSSFLLRFCLQLHTVSQAASVPSDVVARAAQATPADYKYRDTGYARTCGQIMADDNPALDSHDWQLVILINFNSCVFSLFIFFFLTSNIRASAAANSLPSASSCSLVSVHELSFFFFFSFPLSLSLSLC